MKPRIYSTSGEAMDKAAQDLAWARWSLARWGDFPVAHVPRPLVLVGPDHWPEGGFRSGDAKLAFLYGQVEAASDAALPEPVLAALRSHHHEALPGRSAKTPLIITSGRLSEVEFLTDRGRRSLPAWRLEADEAIGPIWVLDPDLLARAWAPKHPPPVQPPFGGSPHRSISAILHPDGRTMTFHFIGGDSSFEDYPRAEVVESAQALTVVPVVRDIGPPGSRTLGGHRREVQARLAQPLGARVLVDLDGSAAEVSLS